jgi:predicted metal-dependent hydrolase
MTREIGFSETLLSNTFSMQLDLLRSDYRLVEKRSARARRIRVEIRSADEVWLVVPRWASLRTAHAFLQERREWVERKLAEQRLRRGAQPVDGAAMRWDGSDHIPLRGVKTALRIEPARLRRATVRFDDGGIRLFCPPGAIVQPAGLVRVLTAALREEATRDARRLLVEEAARLGVNYQGPRIADQKSLWGSCAAGGLISLSWRLVLAPPAVFRYVVVHELCHLRHRDHSERFWALVAEQMPDYATHYRWLRAHGERLHAVLSVRGDEQ